jgi:hypothetical protein
MISILRVLISSLSANFFETSQYRHSDSAARRVLEMMLVDNVLKWPTTQQNTFKVLNGSQ